MTAPLIDFEIDEITDETPVCEHPDGCDNPAEWACRIAHQVNPSCSPHLRLICNQCRDALHAQIEEALEIYDELYCTACGETAHCIHDLIPTEVRL